VPATLQDVAEECDLTRNVLHLLHTLIHQPVGPVLLTHTRARAHTHTNVHVNARKARVPVRDLFPALALGSRDGGQGLSAWCSGLIHYKTTLCQTCSMY
jgi:hypothetical protein